MKLVSFMADGQRQVGVQVANGVAPTGYRDLLELITDGEKALIRARDAAQGQAVRVERVLAPLRPGKMLFCGINFPDHAEENSNAVMPAEPYPPVCRGSVVCTPRHSATTQASSRRFARTFRHRST
jgi:2-keto-4-pentenoate hydratase/2-oxohepta-3-ene-1,7-dioic acid hydratase in catechol pathway